MSTVDPTPAMTHTSDVLLCPSCEAALAGDYCARCGQRAPRPSDFTIRALAQQLWREVSGSDSRLWRTLLGLFRPGVLTLAYVQYRWQRYLPPLRLYLLVSAVFFLVAWDAYFLNQVLEARNAAPGTMPEGLRAMYADPDISGRISDWAAAYRFAGVLVLGLVVALLHLGKRVAIGKHLVFATHYYCADFAIFLLAWPLVNFAPAEHYQAVSSAVLLVGIRWLGWWAVLADRRVYGGGWAGNLLRGLAVLAADMVISSVSLILAVSSLYARQG